MRKSAAGRKPKPGTSLHHARFHNVPRECTTSSGTSKHIREASAGHPLQNSCCESACQPDAGRGGSRGGRRRRPRPLPPAPTASRNRTRNRTHALPTSFPIGARFWLVCFWLSRVPSGAWGLEYMHFRSSGISRLLGLKWPSDCCDMRDGYALGLHGWVTDSSRSPPLCKHNPCERSSKKAGSWGGGGGASPHFQTQCSHDGVGIQVLQQFLSMASRSPWQA